MNFTNCNDKVCYFQLKKFLNNIQTRLWFTLSYFNFQWTQYINLGYETYWGLKGVKKNPIESCEPIRPNIGFNCRFLIAIETTISMIRGLTVIQTQANLIVVQTACNYYVMLIFLNRCYMIKYTNSKCKHSHMICFKFYKESMNFIYLSQQKQFLIVNLWQWNACIYYLNNKWLKFII